MKIGQKKQKKVSIVPEARPSQISQVQIASKLLLQGGNHVTLEQSSADSGDENLISHTDLRSNTLQPGSQKNESLVADDGQDNAFQMRRESMSLRRRLSEVRPRDSNPISHSNIIQRQPLPEICLRDLTANGNLSGEQLAQEGANKFLEQIQYKIDLGQLYKIVDSCYRAQNGFWCPIIVKIGESLTKIDRKESRISNNFLLQVWSRDGDLVYERQLAAPVKAWGIFENTFVFQEQDSFDEVFLVRLERLQIAKVFRIVLAFDPADKKDLSVVDKKNLTPKIDQKRLCYAHGNLYLGTEKTIYFTSIDPQLLQIKEEVTESQEYHLKLAEVPKIVHAMKLGKLEDDIARFGESRVNKQAFKDVIEGEIIFRIAPEKIFKLQLDNKFNFRGFINSSVDQSAMILEKVQIPSQESNGNAEEQKLTMIDRLCCQKKEPGIFNFNEFGEESSLSHRSLFFIRIDGLENQQTHEEGVLNQNSTPELLLRKMGLILGSPQFQQNVKTDAEIVDISSVSVTNDDSEEENDGNSQQDHNVTMVLRSDGSVEFYSDYIFIETSQKWEKKFDKERECFVNQKIKKIDSNFKHIVLQIEEIEGEKIKSQTNADKKQKVKKKAGQIMMEPLEVDPTLSANNIGQSQNQTYSKIVNYKIQLDWKNKIGQTSMVTLSDEKFKDINEPVDQCLHSRLKQHVKLYTEFLNFESFVLVAHRYFISIFSFNEGRWLDKPWIYDDFVRYITTNSDEHNKVDQMAENVRQLASKSIASRIKSSNVTQEELQEQICKLQREQAMLKQFHLEQKLNNAFTPCQNQSKVSVSVLYGQNTLEVQTVDFSGTTSEEDNFLQKRGVVMKVGKGYKNARIIHYSSNRSSKEKGLVMLVGEAKEEFAGEERFTMCGLKNQFRLYSCQPSQIISDPSKLNIFFYLGGNQIHKLQTRRKKQSQKMMQGGQQNQNQQSSSSVMNDFIKPTSHVRIFNTVDKQTLSASKKSPQPVPKEEIGTQVCLILYDPLSSKAMCQLISFERQEAKRGEKINQDSVDNSLGEQYQQDDGEGKISEVIADESDVTWLNFAPKSWTAQKQADELQGKSGSNRLVNIFVCMDPETYGAHQFSILLLMSDKILIFNKSGDLQRKIEHTSIKKVLVVDDWFMYCLADPITQPVTLFDFNQFSERELMDTKEAAGIYVYDLYQLISNDRIEMYKLNAALVGKSSSLSYCSSNARLGFIRNYHHLSMLPIVHRNTIRFLGMKARQNYLIFREHGNFLSGYSRSGELTTWCKKSGQIVGHNIDNFKPNLELSDFQVYQADASDCSNLTGFRDRRQASYSLLCSQTWPENQQIAEQTVKKVLLKTGIDNIIQHKELQQEANKEVKMRKTLKIIGNEEIYFGQDNNKGHKVSLFQDINRSKIFIFKLLKMTTENSQHSLQRKKLNKKGSLCCNKSDKDQDDQEENGECRSENCRGEICIEEEFSFRFPLFLPQQNEHKEEIIDPIRQRIYLSENQERLMEIVDRTIARFYVRKRIEDEKEQKKEGVTHKFTLIGSLNQFPSNLQGDCSLPFLFSPNFDLYFDVDFERNKFVIRNNKLLGVYNKEKVEKFSKIQGYNATDEIYLDIPEDLIKIQGKMKAQQKLNLQNLAKRLSFLDNDHIRILTDQNFDSIFRIQTEKCGKKMMSLVLESCTRIDNTLMLCEEDKHINLEQAYTDTRQVLTRLMRKSDAYKINMDLIEWAKKKLKSGGQIPEWAPLEADQTKKIYTIDYSQSEEMLSGAEPNQMQIELTFTLLDWAVLKRIFDSSTFGIEDVDEEQRFQLCFNIFPKGKTSLHLIEEAAFISPSFDPENAARVLFEQLEAGNEDKGIEGGQCQMPILKDLEGQDVVQKIFSNPKEIQLTLASTIFEKIKDYSYMQLGNDFSEQVLQAIKLDIVNIAEFIESRTLLVDSQEISSFQRPQKRATRDYHDGNLEEYGVLRAPLIGSTKDTVNRLFSSNIAKPARQMRIQRFDLPALTVIDQKGAKFLEKLVKYSNQELFSQRAVQKIINCFWSQSQWLVLILFFFPHIIQLLIFLFWSSFIFFEQYQSDAWMIRYLSFASEFFLLGLSFWFLLLEILQIKSSAHLYLSQPQNLIDFLPPVLVIFTVAFSMSDKLSVEEMTAPKQWYYVLLSFTSLLLWLKFLLFLRVFPFFAYIVQMLFETAKELWPFITVTLMSVLGFADAFYSLALFQINTEYLASKNQSASIGNNDDPLTGVTGGTAEIISGQSDLEQIQPEIASDEQPEEEDAYFIQKFGDAIIFACTATLGGWDGDDLDMLTFFGWVLFVMLTIFNLIILLNFVIAIITEVYMNVRDKQVQSTYEEKAKLILDVIENPLINPFRSSIFGASENQILYFATEMTSQRLQESILQAEEQEKGAIEAENQESIQEIKRIVQTFTQEAKRDFIREQKQMQDEKNKKKNMEAQKSINPRVALKKMLKEMCEVKYMLDQIPQKMEQIRESQTETQQTWQQNKISLPGHFKRQSSGVNQDVFYQNGTNSGDQQQQQPYVESSQFTLGAQGQNYMNQNTSIEDIRGEIVSSRQASQEVGRKAHSIKKKHTIIYRDA